MLIPALIGFIGLTYFAYRLAVWGEKKHYSLGTWIPLAYILIVTIGGLMYILPETAAMFQFYLLLIFIGLAAGIIGIVRQQKLFRRPTSAIPPAPGAINYGTGDPAIDNDPRFGMDLFAEERRQNMKDAAEIWDQRQREIEDRYRLDEEDDEE